ncbi:replicative DNA helicase [Anaeromusa acidaminophila]|uniref:replicative DNA helicase n=1 Tax=Anaeromusa acidaminophila TaxID=81464 RepID=UPI00037D5635|nr:DnaB-like helicase C-terminal domain-containing protein [Anaeromusa acidaminophila]
MFDMLTPPASEESERAILGCIFKETALVMVAMKHLNKEDFYTLAHQHIFHAMLEVVDADKTIDLITVIEQLKNENHLEAAGGIKYITGLADVMNLYHNIEEYCAIVKEHSIRRKLLYLIMDCYKDFQNEEPLATVISRLYHGIRIAEANDEQKALYTPKTLLSRCMNELKHAAVPNATPAGLSTGLPSLDELVRGIQKKQVILIAARPGHCKTTLALSILGNVVLKEQQPAILFSPSVPATPLFTRMIMAEAGVAYDDLYGWTDQEIEKCFARTVEQFSTAPLYIDDRPYLSGEDIKNTVRQVRSKGETVSLIVIDYLQMMAEMDMSVLRQIARDMDVAVIVVYQLGRSIDQRHNKRPLRSDLKENDSLEAADIILLLYREACYYPDVLNGENLDVVEIMLTKHPNGPLGTKAVQFDERYGQIKEIEQGEFYR